MLQSSRPTYIWNCLRNLGGICGPLHWKQLIFEYKPRTYHVCCIDVPRRWMPQLSFISMLLVKSHINKIIYTQKRTFRGLDYYTRSMLKSILICNDFLTWSWQLCCSDLYNSGVVLLTQKSLTKSFQQNSWLRLPNICFSIRQQVG